MKITLSIDDEALQIAREYAVANGVRLGKAVAMLVKMAAAPPLKLRQLESGFLVYDLPPGNPITAARVKRFQDG